MFLLSVLIATVLVSLPYLTVSYPPLQPGDVHASDIRVPFDVRYELTLETERLRQEARERVQPVFDLDAARLEAVVALSARELEGSFPEVREREETIRRMLWRLSERYALVGNHDEVAPAAYRNGFRLHLLNRPGSEDEDRIWDAGRLVDVRNRILTAGLILNDEENQTFEEGQLRTIAGIISGHLAKSPPVVVNRGETRRLREEAARDVRPVKSLLRRGTVIIRAGEPVTRESAARYGILRGRIREARVKRMAGAALVILIFAGSTVYFLYRFYGDQFRELPAHLMLHSVLIGFFAVSTGLVMLIPDARLYMLAPVAFVSATLDVLFGFRAALVLGVYASVFVLALSGFEASSFLVPLIGVQAGIYASHRMQKRSQILRSAFLIGFILILTSAGLHLAQGEFPEKVMRAEFTLAFANGIVSILLMTGVLPLFEGIFNIPTKFRLRELADFNNPLLRKLAATAPSTYQHSLMMATLSETAVSAIGGDSLLTKTGCLYHDIGKMNNASLYAENRHLLEHSDSFRKLGPLKSARMIIAHVEDGIAMARKHRLPDRIIDFIPEHHGTTTMQYFYHQALENAGKSGGKTVNRNLYRYPGPRPRSRETGVVMIADSVEAASRSLPVPDRKNLEELIDRVIQNKRLEQQFDECPLTEADMRVIKETFTDILIASFHGRPAYPSMKATAELEKRI